MNRTYHRTSDGQQVGEHDAFDEHGSLRDGHTMRTRLLIMDGVPTTYAPLLTITDADKRAAQDRYEAKIRDAWKSTPSLADEKVIRDAKLAGERAGISDPYERYERRLQDAWR
jgi:hypothetical protein